MGLGILLGAFSGSILVTLNSDPWFVFPEQELDEWLSFDVPVIEYNGLNFPCVLQFIHSWYALSFDFLHR